MALSRLRTRAVEMGVEEEAVIQIHVLLSPKYTRNNNKQENVGFGGILSEWVANQIQHNHSTTTPERFMPAYRRSP
jgi:hypothetical protein